MADSQAKIAQKTWELSNNIMEVKLQLSLWLSILICLDRIFKMLSYALFHLSLSESLSRSTETIVAT